MRRPPPHAMRRRLLLAGILFGSLTLLGRSFYLQGVEADRWRARASDQQRQRVPLPASRGAIYDRNGVLLATSKEAYRVAVAPRELRDRAAAAKRLQETLGLSAAEARRAVDPQRRWVVLAGRYDALSKQRMEGERGVHFERLLERLYPHGDLAIELMGRVSTEGRGQGGLEQEYDSLLAGRAGEGVARRDHLGRPLAGSLIPVVEPVAGADLVLTIDYTLQEIAHEALGQAVTRTGASGGELLLVDPRTGDILAAASRREDGARQWRGAIETYEPGSTLKPFVVAALIAQGRVELEDTVYAEEGNWTHDGRTLRDTKPHGWLTMREALVVSSNVAFGKLSALLEPAEQYGYLRDFGFGAPTGLRFPSEASGLLRRPKGWSRYSQVSLAIGYELGVTPLQMTMAYSALANGGILMEPRLVREVRERDGRVLHGYAPRAVRRVVPERVAMELAATLVDVVEVGTGQEAGLESFQVAGKTGTARLFSGGRYESGGYTASFAGFFPAKDPQLAFLVKLDRPQGAYYGGIAAAPVTRATLAAALAARSTVLDRRAFASVAAARNTVLMPSGARAAKAETGPVVPPADTRWVPPAPGPFIFTMDGKPASRYRVEATPAARPVPNVVGLPVRDAARRLHGQGYSVEVQGTGPVAGTIPAVGALVPAGGRVRILGREGG